MIDLTLTENISLYAISFICLVSSFIYLGFYSKFAFRSSTKLAKEIESLPPVSIVIYTKNGYEALIKKIQRISDQTYPTIQIIVVNDFSNDDTHGLCEDERISTILKNPNIELKLLNIDQYENFSGSKSKKFALTLGIKASDNDMIITTDAYSLPTSEQWLQHMVGSGKGGDILIGHSSFEPHKGLFSLFYRFVNVQSSILSYTFAIMNRPFRGNETNFGFRKSLFMDNGGYVSHMQVVGGGTDIFINEVSSSANTKTCITKCAYVRSPHPATFSHWLKTYSDSVRFFSYYSFTHKFILSSLFLTNILFFMTLVLFLTFFDTLSPPVLQVCGGMFAFRYICYYIVVSKSARKLDEKDVLILLPILEFLSLVVRIILNLITPKYKAKKIPFKQQ